MLHAIKPVLSIIFWETKQLIYTQQSSKNMMQQHLLTLDNTSIYLPRWILRCKGKNKCNFVNNYEQHEGNIGNVISK